MSFGRQGTSGLLRAVLVTSEANEGELRETARGSKKRGKGAPVNVAPCLLLATMRTGSSTNIRSVGINDLTADDVVVLLMGPPGSGKTTFIEIAAGIKGKVETKSESGTTTSDISAFRVSASEFPNSNILLVDTPAFNNTGKSDVEILTMISDWLNQTYKRGIQVSGLIYFHRISEAKMEGTWLRNWRAFEKICGENFNQIVLATTMWDTVQDEVGCIREKELEDFWRANIVRGSCMKRFLHDRQSAADVLSPILENTTKKPLRLQREITDFDMSLKQTTAARALFLQLEALLRECEWNLVTIRDNSRNPSLNKQELKNLEERYKKSFFLLQRATVGLANLGTSRAERLQGFILMMGLRPAFRFLGLRKRAEAECTPLRRTQADLPSRLKEQRLRQQLDAAHKKIQEYEDLVAAIYYKMCQRCKMESEKIANTSTMESLAAIAPSSPFGPCLPLGLDSSRRTDPYYQNTMPMTPAHPSKLPPLLRGQKIATGNLDPQVPARPPKENPIWMIKYNNKIEGASLKVELEHVLTMEQEVLCSRFSWDGNFLAVGLRGKTGKTCIFDVKTGAQTFVLVDLFAVSKLGVRSLCFSANGRYLATGDGVGQIRIWEFAKKYVRNAFRGHEKTTGTEQKSITDIDFSPNGRFLVSSSDDQSVRIWSIRDGSSTIFQDGACSYFKAVRFSRDGDYVAAANADGKLRVWNARTKQLVWKWTAHERPIFTVAFTRGGLVSGSFDRTLKYWELELEPRGRTVRNDATTEQEEKTLEFTGHTSYVRSATISPTAQWLASGSDDHSVRIWDTSNGSLQCTLEGHQKDIWSVDFSPAGSYLACGSSDRQATIWRYDSVGASA